MAAIAVATVLPAIGASERAVAQAPSATLSVAFAPGSPAPPVLNQPYGYAMDVANNGDVALDDLTTVDTVPVEMAVARVTTGSYTGLADFAAGEGVRVSYEKNTAPGVFTLWGSSPNAATNTTLTAPPPGVGPGEYITRVRWEYGQAAPGMRATARPVLAGSVINPDNAGGPVAVGDAIQNCADLTAVYTAGPTTVDRSSCLNFNLIAGPAIDISTTHSVPLGSTIKATATLTGGNPTGFISFRAYAASDAGCTTPRVAVAVPISGVGSYTTAPFTFPAGAYQWVARYLGDALHAAAATGCNDPAGAFAVVAPPTASASFAPATVAVGRPTALTFTITNPSANSVPLTGVALDDTLPVPLAVASPNGLSGSCGAGTITAAPGSQSVTLLDGTIPVGSSCSFSVDVTASAPGPVTNTTGAVRSANGGAGDTATATLSVDQPPAITSAASASFTPGRPGSFTVTSSGSPTPTLSDVGASLPGGVTFKDNGDGTATLSGTPAADSGGTYRFTITAANGAPPDARQSFTLIVPAPPTAPIVPAPPTVSIASPSDGARFTRGQRVPAAYTCQEGAGGPGLSSCAGTAPDGRPIDTGTAGRHSFTVTAISQDGLHATQTVSYTVVLPDNRFTVRHVRARPSARIRFGLTVPGPGVVDVLETAGQPGVARAARLLQPKPWRSVFARKHLTVARAGARTVTVYPDQRGRRLIVLRPGRVWIRLWVSYTPTHGRQRNIGMYAIHIPRPRHHRLQPDVVTG